MKPGVPRCRPLMALWILCMILYPSSPGLSQARTTARPSISVTGTVVDRESGAPLQYSVVGIPEVRSWDLSEADGSFSLQVTGSGVYRLVAMKRGWSLGEYTVTLDGSDVLKIALSREREVAPEGPGRLVGRVFDVESGTPVPDAAVRITPTSQEALTDDMGRFLVSGISSGALLVEVEGEGYPLRADTLAAFPGVTLAVEIPLSRDPTLRGAVSVEERPRYLEAVGFYRRAETLAGYRFGRYFLRTRSRDRLTEVILTNVPGLRTATGPFGERALTAEGTDGNRCPVTVYLDRVAVIGFDMDSYPVDRIEALEAYVGNDRPLEFDHGCGVILIWSRRPD